MENLSKTTWAKIHDFLLSIGPIVSVDELNSRILANLPDLVHFENSGVLIDLDKDLKPEINARNSIRIKKDWSAAFNDYYHRIGVFPDIDRNIFSADYLNTGKYDKDEYVNDYLRPQGIYYSAGLIIFGRENTPIHFVVLNRTSDEHRFSPVELAVLKIIQPHLSNYYKTAYELEGFRRMPLLLTELEKHTEVLSPRESEIVYLLALRFKPAEIAGKLKISHYTVRKHIENIYKKLNVTDRHQLFQRINSDYKKN
jgi:DNA-binding CsgD family transcriptional regulator